MNSLYEIYLKLFQKELCGDCPVQEYQNRKCDNCSQNITKQIQELRNNYENEKHYQKQD